MGLLDEAMQFDNAAFGNSDDFAESVTYKPYGGSNRTIKAVVNRDVEPIGDEVEPMLVDVDNHVTTGITSTELNAGKDRITVAFRSGETAEDYVLGNPTTVDAARMTFRISTIRSR